MSFYSWCQKRVLACCLYSVFLFSSNISCAVSRKWSVPLRCLESGLSFFSVPLVSGLMSCLASHPSIRRVADVPCFRFSLPAKRDGASCSAELDGLFSRMGINSCFWMFGDGTMGRWEFSRFIFRQMGRAGGRSGGRQRRDMADRYERSEGHREVRKCVSMEVSMLIQNIIVKSFWGQGLGGYVMCYYIM